MSPPKPVDNELEASLNIQKQIIADHNSSGVGEKAPLYINGSQGKG